MVTNKTNLTHRNIASEEKHDYMIEAIWNRLFYKMVDTENRKHLPLEPEGVRLKRATRAPLGPFELILLLGYKTLLDNLSIFFCSAHRQPASMNAK